MHGCNQTEGWPGGLIEPMFSSAGASPLALCTYTDKKTSDNHVLTQHAANTCVNCVLPLTLTFQMSLPEVSRD